MRVLMLKQRSVFEKFLTCSLFEVTTKPSNQNVSRDHMLLSDRSPSNAGTYPPPSSLSDTDVTYRYTGLNSHLVVTLPSL